MSSTTNSGCAKCLKGKGLKHCGRCKTVSYCCEKCQEADWSHHKLTCQFNITLPIRNLTDALSKLRQSTDLASLLKVDGGSDAVSKALNTAEIRMGIFSSMSAKVLLTSMRVCRLWYRTIALETTMQQRVFMEPDYEGKVLVAYNG